MGDLNELIASIRSVGLIHPILIRPSRGNKFEVVAGYRRFEACRTLRWLQIPAIIREMSEREAYEIALAENVQRKSMNPIEEARAFRKYVENEGWGGVTRLGERIGKSKSYVSQRILLLSLPATVQELLETGEIKPCAARELLPLKDSAVQEDLARKVTELQLSTRSTAYLLKSMGDKERNSGVITTTNDHQEISSPDFTNSVRDRSASSSVSTRALQQTILALRLTLARLDIVKEKCEGEDPEMSRYIHDLRLEIHTMIDDCVRKKMIKVRSSGA